MTTITGKLAGADGVPTRTIVAFELIGAPWLGDGVIVSRGAACVLTNEDGEFSIQLAAGRYRVRWEHASVPSELYATVPDEGTHTLDSISDLAGELAVPEEES